MTANLLFEFSATLWQYGTSGSWYFVSLPVDLSREIREHSKWLEEGWGRMKVKAAIGDTAWDTAIWFDTKRQTYLLPLKVEIRRKEKIEPNQQISVILSI